MIHEAILCLGSNVEPCRQAIDEAISRINAIAEIDAVSNGLSSPDVSGRGCDYLNVAVRCHTDMLLDEFTARLALFEQLGGRLPSSKSSGTMPIDIDLIIWDTAILSPADYSRPYFQSILATLPRHHFCRGSQHQK